QVERHEEAVSRPEDHDPFSHREQVAMQSSRWSRKPHELAQRRAALTPRRDEFHRLRLSRAKAALTRRSSVDRWSRQPTVAGWGDDEFVRHAARGLRGEEADGVNDV